MTEDGDTLDHIGRRHHQLGVEANLGVNGQRVRDRPGVGDLLLEEVNLFLVRLADLVDRLALLGRQADLAEVVGDSPAMMSVPAFGILFSFVGGPPPVVPRTWRSMIRTDRRRVRSTRTGTTPPWTRP